MKLSSIILLVLSAGVSPVYSQAIINSPDKAIRLTVTASKDVFTYAIAYRGKTAIEPSPLGLNINGKTLPGNGLTIGNISTYTENTTYHPSRGFHSIATNHCNGAKINIRSGGDYRSFAVDVKVFNDGVAFRYIINSGDSSQVTADNTGFVIPAGSEIWMQTDAVYYEGEYVKYKIEDVKAGEVAGPPVTIKLPGSSGYAAITEGGLVDFGGMGLIAKGNNELQAKLSGITRKKGRVQTPWRIVEIGPDLNTLVNCDIVANVSAAMDKKLFPQGYNTAWVKPGRSLWSWLGGGGVTVENMKYYCKMAAELGFEYNLIDEGWGHWKENGKTYWDLVKEVVDYGNSLGVKTWIWKAYPDRDGIAGLQTTEKRKAFFTKCRDLGIAGLKIDFFNSENQEIINFYQAALHDAAAYHLMMDFHGANKPTGESHTWPNEMTREAIKGLENSPPWAKRNTILPFTRYLAGPADYTPLHFGERMGETTWAHQIASMTIFTSPFLCLGATPKDIAENPFKTIIQSIPTTWDETIVLPQSKIGEVAVFARRKGSTWFVAAMNGPEAGKMKIEMSFLGAGNYNASLIKDDESRQNNALPEKLKVTKQNFLNVEMNDAGGFVAKFIKSK